MTTILTIQASFRFSLCFLWFLTVFCWIITIVYISNKSINTSTTEKNKYDNYLFLVSCLLLIVSFIAQNIYCGLYIQ